MGNQTNAQTIVTNYKKLTQECDSILTKIEEIDIELNEHKLVEETLKPLDSNRRSYRLIGGVLVERTVGEVLPSVIINRENLELVLSKLRKSLEEKQKESKEMKEKYNIKSVDEVEA